MVEEQATGQVKEVAPDVEEQQTDPVQVSANNTANMDAVSGNPASATGQVEGQTILGADVQLNPDTPSKVPDLPEKYELNIPDGMELKPEQQAAFEAQARELGLDAEKAQKLLDMAHGNQQAARQMQAAQIKKWAEEAQADPEIGGEYFNANVATANFALKTYDPDGAIARMLKETGYGNNPAVVRFFYRIGKAMGGDNVPKGDKGESAQRPLEDRLYPNWKV